MTPALQPMASLVYTAGFETATASARYPMSMLAHLLVDDEIVPLVENVDAASIAALPRLPETPPDVILDAQVRTADIISLLDDENEDPVPDLQRAAATRAFMEMTNGTSLAETRAKLTRLKVPKAVRHLVGMLTAYEWEFVDQAKELRGYAVAQIVEETKHHDAKVRLRALEMLGKVTEVALFTERVEVKNANLSDEELDNKLREKLQRFIGASDAVAKPPAEIEDASYTLVPVIHKPNPADLIQEDPHDIPPAAAP